MNIEKMHPSSAEEQQPPIHAATRYTRLMAPDTVSLYTELGLDPAFGSILTQQLQDLHLTTQGGVQNSYLTLSAHREDPYTVYWHRELVVSQQQHRVYEKRLEEGYNSLPDELKYHDLDTATLMNRLAVDWIFFELSADAAAESCYMQHKYDRYIPGFNGQNPHWRADLKISHDYLQDQLGTEPNQLTCESDHKNFRAGIAMILLHDSILKVNLLESSTAARWLISYLQNNYPSREKNHKIVPHTQSDIALRLSGIVPRDNDIEQYLQALDKQQGRQE